MAERTLIIIKPDTIQRNLTDEIISRFEAKGFKLVAAKFMKISKDLARRHYTVHNGKPFYKGLVKYISSNPSLVMVWQADGVIEMARKMIGATFGYEVLPGTIRGDFSCSRGFNLIHGSDSAESAKKEIELFFKPVELVEYELTDNNGLYGRNN